MAVWNAYQSSEEDLGLSACRAEVLDEFWGFMDSVPYLKWLTSPARPHAADMPRDERGRIVVDIAHPHILDDMDYFRPAALHFRETGRYCDFSPNPNPNSEFGRWFEEETRRCLDGYVRESDGEWVTGDNYFFLNYFPILQNRLVEGSGHKAEVFSDFPRTWDSHYLWFHYLQQARDGGLHGAMLASRGKGKSYSVAAMLLRRLVVGETPTATRGINCMAIADKEVYLKGPQRLLMMFSQGLEHTRVNTQFRSSMIRESLTDMVWEAGYMDPLVGRRGSHNTVLGETAEKASTIRGARTSLLVFEEMGSFPALGENFNKNLYLVELDGNVFGQVVMIGTAGDRDSDFQSIQRIMYSPEGYHMLAVENVYDREGLGRPTFIYFLPGYMSYANAYDRDGNSDVTRGLLSICMERDLKRRKTNDPAALTALMSECPVVPQEAILRSARNIFPVQQINERILELDSDPRGFDDVWAGSLVLRADGGVEFRPTGDRPIRDFPLGDRQETGAVEIFAMPQGSSEGRVPAGRYIMGVDPIDNDSVSDSVSLFSCFAFDLFTDSICAEYTGRMEAERCYEVARLMALMYNARVLYENNIKGLFSYFSRMNAMHLLADTPEYLKDRQVIKMTSSGLNTTKGVRATAAVNAFANELIIKWLGSPRTAVAPDGTETTVPNLSAVRSRALLKEMSLFTPVLNVDRIRALGMVMLLREEMVIRAGGDLTSLGRTRDDPGNPENDPYFSRVYDRRFGRGGTWGDDVLRESSGT